MNLTKKIIIKKIVHEISLSSSDSFKIFEFFLEQIKTKSKMQTVKISNFGSFKYNKSPKRVGRNPLTKASYIIPSLNKLNFAPSKKIKEILN
jgi:nucleoid DNA-binding protein